MCLKSKLTALQQSPNGEHASETTNQRPQILVGKVGNNKDAELKKAFSKSFKHTEKKTVIQ